MRLSVKTTVYAHIGTVNFVIQFKESPCSPVVSLPSFGSEGHGVQTPQGDSVLFFIMFVLESIDIFRTIFFFLFSVSTKLGVERPFKKEHETLSDLKIYPSCHVFSHLSRSLLACIQ